MYGQREDAARFGSTDSEQDYRLFNWFREADAFFQSNLTEREEDWDYFEGRQFTDEDIKALEDRGQPKTVINRTRVATELVMGIYDKTRMDCMMLPRGITDDDWMTAQGLTHGSKFVEDANDTPLAYRGAFRDVVVSGEGWLESCLSQDPMREELCENYVDWREMRRDPRSKLLDYSDARYVFRTKWYDLDEAKVLMPEHAGKLDEVAGDSILLSLSSNAQSIVGDKDFLSVPQMESSNKWSMSEWLDLRRNQVLLLECWYYTWDRASFIRDKRTGRVVEYNPKNMGRAEAALILGGVSGSLPVEILRDRPIRRCRRALLAGPYVLEDEESPYRHNQIPFIPFYGWLDSKSGNAVGMVRSLKDPQDAANKALSKLILALSTNQVVMEENAGNAEILRKEASRPDGFMIVSRNSMKEGRFQLNKNTVDAQAHQAVFEMFQRVTSDMAGGLELQGIESNASSGRAIALRQEQGHTTLSTIFENFRHAKRRFVELRLANIQQYWQDEKYIRITEVGDPDRREMIVLNEKTPDGGIRNDVTALKVDVIIDEQNARASVRQQFADRFMDFLQKMPDPLIAMSMMDIVVDMYDLPDRPVVKQRIRQAMALAGVMQSQAQQPQMGSTPESAPPPPTGMPSGGEGSGFGPEVQSRLAAADAGPAVNNLGR